MDILDEKPREQKSKLYSLVSFIFLAVYLLLIAYLTISGSTDQAKMKIPLAITYYPSLITLIICLIRNESWSFYKTCSFVIHLLLFISIIAIYFTLQ